MPDQTHNIFDFIKQAWPQLIGLVALVVWLVRGESNTKANSSEIRRIWRQRDEDLRSHKEARDITNNMLDEVRRDIKTLLARRE